MNIGLEYDNLLPPYSEYFKLRLELKQAFIKELLFIRNIADWICKGIEKLNKNNLDTA